MDIYLVRHGEAAASWGQAADPGLSPLGLEQAHGTAQALQPQLDGEVLLLSSPLSRARETAAPLAERLGLPVRVDEAFREIRAPVPLADRQQWLRHFMRQRWDEQPDSLLEWRDQATRQIKALGGPAVIFTHFLVINAVVGQIQGAENTLCCWPDYGSITHLRYRDNALELVTLGAQMQTVVN